MAGATTRCDAARPRGFAYVWVLLGVALVGAGAALAAQMHSTFEQRERERELLRIGHEFRTAIGRYKETRPPGGRSDYPPDLEALLEDKRFPGVRRHLRRIYHDPMTGRADWGLVRVNGRIVGVHSLSQRSTVKRDGFAPSDLSFKGKESVDQWVFAYPDAAASAPAGAASEPRVGATRP